MALMEVINGVLHWHAYEGQTFVPVTALYSDGLKDSNQVVLVMGPVTDGQYLKRQGSNIIGTSTVVAEVDYTPAVLGDWDGSVDPGGMDEALDQLASRLTINTSNLATDISNLSVHMADAVDPHGASMSVSTRLTTPYISNGVNSTFVIDAEWPGPSTCIISNTDEGTCNLQVDGSVVVMGTVDGVDIATRDAVLTSHMADTVDPHGGATTISVEVLTPQIKSTGATLTLDTPSTGISHCWIKNSGSGNSVTAHIVGDVTISGVLSSQGDFTALSNINVTGTVDGRNVSVDGTTLDVHTADTIDPHGASMTITTQLDVPKISHAGSVTLDMPVALGQTTFFLDNTGAAGAAHLDVKNNVRVGLTLKIADSATTITKDGSGNMVFADINAGSLTLSELSKPKLIQLVDDNAAAGFNELTDYHILDGTNWNTSKSVIKEILFETTSTQWDFYLLQNDNGFAIDDAVIKKRKIVSGAKGNLHLVLDVSYEDEDATGELHFYFEDKSGTAKLDKIIVLGVEAR